MLPWAVAAAWAVVGGTPVPGPYAGPVVGIAGPDGVFCTGVVVDPRWVLTAAHCLVADPPPAEVWWGADLEAGPDAAIAVDLSASRADPAWTGARAHDVALLALAADAAGPIAHLAEGTPVVGRRLDVFGFGDTTDGAGDRGTLRTARLDVQDVDEQLVRTYTPGKNLCSGDSGAPLVVPGAEPPLVLAVGGFVDPTCLGGAGGGAHVEAVWGFLREVVPTLERHPAPQRLDTADTAAPDDTATTDTTDTGQDPPPPAVMAPGRGCGCGPSSGARGAVGAAAGLLVVAGARRRGPGRPARACPTGAPRERQKCRTPAPPARPAPHEP